jgi:hypothetical protein
VVLVVEDNADVRLSKQSILLQPAPCKGPPVNKPPDSRPRAVRYVRTDVEALSPNRCRATVELVRDSGERYVGVAENGDSPEQRLNAVARAALDAVRQAVTPPPELVLEEVTLMEAVGKESVLVGINVHTGATTAPLPLLGISVVVGDTGRAAALAVLSAVNRFFGLG